MELSPKQQVTELVRKFNKILVVTHARPDGDALGSMLAMKTTLAALGKDVHAVMLDEIPEMYHFMPGIDTVDSRMKGSNDLVLSVDTSKVPVDKLKYNTKDEKLNIIVSPKQGAYTEDDVTVSSGSQSYDLIVVLDCPDLDRVGQLYEDDPDLFYETPVVNIDHHPSNDYFGAVNLVDLTSTSTCEILVGVIEALGESLITEDVATQLLTGLITDTGSFQNTNTTPKSLTVSAQLVAAGGRQQEIIQHVYKTKPLSTLRLWGRALTKLQYDPAARMVWSTVSKKDFEETGGTTTDAKSVIDALMSSAPDAEIIVLLREGDGKVDGSVRTAKGVDATKIVGFWNGGGHTGAAGFDVPGTLEEAESKVVRQIRAWQLERLEKAGEVPEGTMDTARERDLVQEKQGDAAQAKPQQAPAQRVAQPKSQPKPQAQQSRQPQRSPRQPKPQNQKQYPAPKPAEQVNPKPQAPAQPQAQPNQSPPAQQPQNGDQQAPLTDEQLDAYFKKTSGNDDVIDAGSGGNA